MPYYRVMLDASGICVPGADPDNPIVGFFTTRLVRAACEVEAVGKAKEAVLSQWSTPEYTKKNSGRLPELALEWVKRTTWLDSLLFRGTGHMFYTSEENAA